MESDTSTAKSDSRLKSVFRLITSNKEAVVGTIISSVFIITAIVVEIANLSGTAITPYNPLEQNVGPALASPSWKYPFGTDLVGRDVFSRVIIATPNDLAVGIVVVGVALF